MSHSGRTRPLGLYRTIGPLFESALIHAMAQKPPLLTDFEATKINDFLQYLDVTQKTLFDVLTQDGFYQIPYVHRWTKTYKNRILAKLYNFQNWYRQSPAATTMLTLTTRQRNISRSEQMELLLDSYTKLMKVIRKIHKKQNSVKVIHYNEETFRRSTRAEYNGAPLHYIRIMEPHKTGYAHLHILLLMSFSKEEADHISYAWEHRYSAGNSHGVDLSQKSQHEMLNPVAYLMKYMSKSLTSDNMSPGEILHASTVYNLEHDPNAKGVRLITFSRSLSKILKVPDERTQDEIADSKEFGGGYMVWGNSPYSEFHKRDGTEAQCKLLDKRYKELMKLRF